MELGLPGGPMKLEFPEQNTGEEGAAHREHCGLLQSIPFSLQLSTDQHMHRLSHWIDLSHVLISEPMTVAKEYSVLIGHIWGTSLSPGVGKFGAGKSMLSPTVGRPASRLLAPSWARAPAPGSPRQRAQGRWDWLPEGWVRPCGPLAGEPAASRFQIVIYFICAFQNISCGIHYLASVFMTVSPYHTCRPPGNVSGVLFHNISSWKLEDIWILFFTAHEDSIIVQLQNGEVWELTSCQRFRRDDTSGLNYDYSGRKSSFPCVDGYVYDKSKWSSTVVTQWDLVCNREWLAKVIQPVFMVGVLLGAMVFGHLSDRIGRRFVLWSTSTGMFLFGLAAAFSFNYYSFMIARFLIAMSGSGYLVVVFVYVTEFIGMKSRTWACIQMHSFFAVGTMVVALTGYFVRTWWIYQIVLSTVTVPFVLCCWILPETPFWLLSEGRCEEAQKVVDTIAKWNRARSCKLSELLSLDLNGPVGKEPLEAKKHDLLDLFYDWNVGTRTLTIWLIWFTGCLGFYFFSLNSVNLGGNEYLNLFLMGAVEIPAYIFICLGMDSIGRRKVLVFSLISGALLCGVIMMIPKHYFIWTVVVTMAGKFAIGAAFGLIYLYTAELYPTMVRSLAVGSGSMVSRAGSIMAPFCVYLSDVWNFLPQLLVGILAFISGVLSLMLPETMGRPLATSWEEVAKQDTEKDSSGKSFPITNNTALEKIDVIDSGVSGLSE
ncbi:solute carrier family 22 member 16 [Suricata suricatta]|nr:solute carrier family 22 member 16 [Suricata suricatta]